MSPTTRRAMLVAVAGLANGIAAEPLPQPPSAAALEQAFRQPPASAWPWAYWWWLDSAASREGITADFEAMKRQGIAGVLLFDAGEGGPHAPKGPLFLSEPWRELYRHALREADRLGLELGVNLCSGWNAGGPWVTPEHAAKKIVWSEALAEGPGEEALVLARPAAATNFHRDIAVLALPWRGTRSNQIANLELKAGREYAGGPSISQLADTLASGSAPAASPEPACRLDEVQVLTDRLGPEGRLNWPVPAGRWLVLRFGYTLLGSRTKCTSPGAEGYEIDFLSRDAFDAHFAHTGRPLLEDARRSGARSLKYFHVDSYESGNPSWSPGFAEAFRARRGYELLRWMPVLAGRLLESREASHRFLWDVRRTIADLYATNYYGRLAEWSHQAGLGIHPESSGPFWHHIDALQCAGGNDIPMTEFWKRKEEDKEWVWWLTGQEGFCDLIKQAASAAHTYGRALCQAEAFTTMGPNWEEDPFTMKDIGDRAFCAGLTRHVLCFYVHQPDVRAFPGYQWEAAGTHFDAHVTWWGMSRAWLTYLARSQQLLRQGRFVADFAYFYGEDVPNYVPARSHMNPPLPAGFDCDTLNAEVLLHRLTVTSGRLALPDGLSYRYLVLPHRQRPALSPPVLRKIRDLVRRGATVIGPAPLQAPGLSNWPTCDDQVRTLARELWGANPGPAGERRIGAGRVIWGRTPAEIVAADRLAPDLEFRDMLPAAVPRRFDGVTVPLDWIHRRTADADLYFVANIGDRQVAARVAFRTTNGPPRLWDAVTGGIRDLPEFEAGEGRTVVPLQFAPKQSWFVVFQKGTVSSNASPRRNFPEPQRLLELGGPWEVSFDPAWGGPEKVRFDKLEDWTKRPEAGIRHYSGTATYRKVFDLPASQIPDLNSQISNLKSQIFLDLGRVMNLARVRLNGTDLGVVWTAPWRVDLTPAVQAQGNTLEIEVVNLWPNRLIGDAGLPPAQRRTVTNVRKFEKPGLPLLESGLLGPVTLEAHPAAP